MNSTPTQSPRAESVQKIPLTLHAYSDRAVNEITQKGPSKGRRFRQLALGRGNKIVCQLLGANFHPGYPGLTLEELDGVADEILLAVNAHDAIVAALESARDKIRKILEAERLTLSGVAESLTVALTLARKSPAQPSADGVGK